MHGLSQDLETERQKLKKQKQWTIVKLLGDGAHFSMETIMFPDKTINMYSLTEKRYGILMHVFYGT